MSATRIRIEVYVDGTDDRAVVDGAAAVWRSALGELPGLEAWITRFLADSGDGGVRPCPLGAPGGALAGLEATVSPILLGWASPAVEELRAPVIELGVVLALELDGDPDGGGSDPRDEDGPPGGDDDAGLERWYRQGDAVALWRLMRAFHERFPKAPIYLSHDANEGDAWLSLVADDDEGWSFDAAILPRDVAQRLGRAPAWMERGTVGGALAFADEARFVEPPWAAGGA